MNSSVPAFRAPSPVERVFNRWFGFLVGLGFGPSYNYLLQVRGRKTGKIYSTPVNLMELGGKKFLVAPRGQTQWVRNAQTAGEVTLKRGSRRIVFRLRELTVEEKLPVLKAYLDSYRVAVQRYFTIPAGSSVEAFRAVEANYPAFELLPA